jgi:hypothetical protein
MRDGAVDLFLGKHKVALGRLGLRAHLTQKDSLKDLQAGIAPEPLAHQKEK